jgi:hypothetical protein
MLTDRQSQCDFDFDLPVGRAVFYAVSVVLKENRRSVLPRTSCMKLGNTESLMSMAFPPHCHE